MWYPLKFKPVYKDYLWGGRNLEKLDKVLPAGVVAESWELSCHPDGISVVDNGVFAGMPFPVLIEKHGRELLGDSLPEKYIDKFPLLIKFIDANEWLSVQVHPDDEYASANENGQNGKNEMWYILSARPKARLAYGTVPGLDKGKFLSCINEGKIKNALNYITVAAGDIVYVPAGLLHAIGPGIILVEIQQNSNRTYRVYDYDRVGPDGQKRPLHLEKALEAIDFSSPKGKTKGLEIKLSPVDRKIIQVAAACFASELYLVNNEVLEDAPGKFYVYIFTAGEGIIEYRDDFIYVKKGETVLIPALLGPYRLKGRFEALKTYVPDLRLDVVIPLLEAGYTAKEIRKIAGINNFI